MAEYQPAGGSQHPRSTPEDKPAGSSVPAPSYSRWRTAAHLYFPFVTVAMFQAFGAPFDTVSGNVICVFLSAIPTNWFASLFYPADRPEPTPEQAIRFSRKSDIYRAAILFTYRWFYGTPFNLGFFIADFITGYLISFAIAERPAGTKQRRSEFIVHLTLIFINEMLMRLVPSFLGNMLLSIDRMIWRAAYIALVDDVIGVLTRPNLKTWKGKVVLVLTQAFIILFTSMMILRWRMNMTLAFENDEDFQAALAELNLHQVSEEVGVDFEDDGDRFLVGEAQ
ncbi:hypothetical protein N0V86_000653 [Didymella sp. IMI 355093]|nr:hypothetical protein N0V86_000653 [Didymella sp. IMI 355093]